MFLSAVVLAGGLVRVGRALKGGMKPGPAAAAAIAGQRRAVDRARDSVAQDRRTPSSPRGPSRTGTRSKSRPLSPPERELRPSGGAPEVSPRSFPIDIDRATVKELETLPRIGPSLAARIVAERDANGPFRSLGSLDKRVKGIGPGLAKVIEPFVTFSGR